MYKYLFGPVPSRRLGISLGVDLIPKKVCSLDCIYDPDYITFSGSGEPTLNSQIGKVLQFIKKEKPNIPVAVLTNGTLFYNHLIASNS